MTETASTTELLTMKIVLQIFQTMQLDGQVGRFKKSRTSQKTLPVGLVEKCKKSKIYQKMLLAGQVDVFRVLKTLPTTSKIHTMMAEISKNIAMIHDMTMTDGRASNLLQKH